MRQNTARSLPPVRAMKSVRLVLLLLPLLAACDQLKERAGLPDPVKQEAEGKAVGAACRQSGQGLEDCYRHNEEALKSAVYEGWKEMSEYMLKNNIPEQPPSAEEKKPDRKADAAKDSEPDAKPTKGKAKGKTEAKD